MSEKKQSYKARVLSAFLFFAIFIFAAIRVLLFAKLESAGPLSQGEKTALEERLRLEYASEYQLVKSLPYNLPSSGLNILAESAVLIDMANGCVLYEKNADQVIPPASMTTQSRTEKTLLSRIVKFFITTPHE